MFPGIADRMHKELSMLAPPSVKVAIIFIQLLDIEEADYFLRSKSMHLQSGNTPFG